MDYFTLGLLVWTALFVLLGVVRGFWKALAAALSLVGAYAASATFAPALTQFLLRVFESANLGETVTWVASAALIFMLAGLLIRLAVVLLGRSWPVTHRPLDAAGGAVLSGAYGVALALVTIWGVSFLVETYHARQPEQVTSTDTVNVQQSAVVALSRRLMAGLVRWNALQGGATERTAQIASAYARQPKEVLDAVQDSVRSDEFKQIVGSEEARRMVREQDVEGLQRSSEFVRLMQQPAVQKLRALLADNEAGWSDEAVAEQMVQVWSEVDEVAQSPEVKALINDPEVLSFLRDGGQLTPALLSKAQAFLRATASDNKEAAAERVPELYQWHNEEGQLEVTVYEDIPADKKASAQKISF